MRNLLSIFSFKTLKEKIIPTKAFLVALLILGIVRLLLFIAGPSLINLNNGHFVIKFGNIIDTLNREIPSSNLHCSVIGSSRVAYSIRPELLEQNTNWIVSKTPLSAGTPWEFHKIFTYRKDLLDNIDMLIMDLEIYQFNDSCPSLFYSHENFQELSNITDRVAFFQSPYPVELLKEMWPVHRERRWISKWGKSITNLVTSGTLHVPMDQGWHKQINKNNINNDPTVLNDDDEKIVKRHVDNFKFSNLVAEACVALIQECNKRSIPVIIIVPPVKKAYLSRVKDIDRDAYNRFNDFVSSLQSYHNISIYLTETLTDLPLRADENDFFMDYGHISYTGAAMYTVWLRNQLKQNTKLTDLLNTKSKLAHLP